MKKKLECYWYIFIGTIIGLDDWELMGKYTLSFWKKRLKQLKRYDGLK